MEANNYYGLKRENVTVMKQNGVPAICNTECEIATKEDGHMIMKPHGHGDIHLLMNQVYYPHVVKNSLIFLNNGLLKVLSTLFSSRIPMVFLNMVSVLFLVWLRRITLISVVWQLLDDLVRRLVVFAVW